MVLRTRKHNNHGVVLIVVLIMVVLVTGAVVTYFVRATAERRLSNTSFNQGKVDELARGALDVITGDLKQEIANGSTIVSPTPAPGAVSYPPIYQPTQNAYIVPVPHGAPTPATTGGAYPIPNLVRISARISGNVPAIAAPGVDHPASAMGSTSLSANGRSISPARWNKHYLIPRLHPGGSAADTTPLASFTPPDWVAVTKEQGPAVLATPQTDASGNAVTVVGRYAYAIYDEGGLLDVNVAGYPSTETPAQYGPKGSSLAYADLTQLTDSGGNSLVSAAQIDQLVGWRNYASAQPAGSFLGFHFSAPGASPAVDPFLNYFASNTINPTGFMKVSGYQGTSGTALNGKTDQAIVSRQQLLNLQSQIGFSPDALQYLGTFSREVNAPTFYYPAANTTGSSSGGNTYPVPNPIVNTSNLNILGLRMIQPGKANDGFTWNAGDPLLCRRFPLGRLSLVAYNATNTSTTSDLYQYFGLYRTTASDPDASKSVWIYTGSSGSTTAAASIETLDLVAAEKPSREPNFFEVLKAAIHRDSLGVAAGYNSIHGSGYAGNGDSVDGLCDLQILRIGANMIDQADADSYPTVISYSPVAGTPLYAYGIEDLPYLEAFSLRDSCDAFQYDSFKDQGANSADRQIRTMMVPVLWNPHRTINVQAGSGIPSQIQFYVVGDTAYVLNGPIRPSEPTGSTTSNDYRVYGVSSSTLVSSRYNECGLTGFQQPTAEQNKGSILIDQTQFSSFANPSFIQSLNPNGGTAPIPTGPYIAPRSKNGSALPNHLDKTILGLTLANPVYSQGRQAQSPTINPLSEDLVPFDGYYNPGGNGAPLFELNPGVEQVGLNAVLRYKDYAGNWQVYNALVCNEADPNGSVNTSYDAFGIELNARSTSGVFMWLFGTTQFPIHDCPQTSYGQANWATLSGGTLAVSLQHPTQGTTYEWQEGQIGYQRCEGMDEYYVWKSDPRTGRFGVSGSLSGNNLQDSIGNPALSNGFGWFCTEGSGSSNGTYNVTVYPVGFTDTANSITIASSTAIFPAMWAQNSAANGLGTYYYDNSSTGVARSGLVRPGDNYFTAVSGFPKTSGTSGTNNIYEANTYPLNVTAAGATPTNTYMSTGASGSNFAARPVVLNRPFRSVGELGYVFRDMPYKSLDMASSFSVDAALLDFFTVDSAQTPVVAGKLDLNTHQPKVLQSVLNGSFRVGDPTGAVTMDPTAAVTIAGNIVAATTPGTSTGPLLNKAQLVTTLGTVPNTSATPNTPTPSAAPASTIFDAADVSVNNGGVSKAAYPSIKTQREAPVRALADVANTRTWNLLIDMVAQTGQYPSGTSDPTRFQVSGERRYWLHVAIDRFTGKVVDQQLEPVYE